MTNKQYIGDSVYVEINKSRVILTTENGLPNDPSNMIILEDFVLEAFINYVIKELKLVLKQ